MDQIVDHKGSAKYKRKLLFKVRWFGYSPEEDTWEPYSHVRDCEALDIYIESQPSLKVLKRK